MPTLWNSRALIIPKGHLELEFNSTGAVRSEWDQLDIAKAIQSTGIQIAMSKPFDLLTHIIKVQRNGACEIGLTFQ